MSFQPALQQLVARSPGARGAVLCDLQGEFVELWRAEQPPRGCGELSQYELQIVGAQLASAWLNLETGSVQRGAGSAVEMRLRCEAGTLLCRVLRDGYYLVLLLAPGRPSAGPASFALREAAEQVLAEL
jgi:hypothetical protein